MTEKELEKQKNWKVIWESDIDIEHIRTFNTYEEAINFVNSKFPNREEYKVKKGYDIEWESDEVIPLLVVKKRNELICWVLLNEKGELFNSKIFSSQEDCERFILKQFSNWNEYLESGFKVSRVILTKETEGLLKVIKTIEQCEPYEAQMYFYIRERKGV